MQGPDPDISCSARKANDPERRLKAIVHFARRRDGGGASFRIVSMSAKRPASASAIPRWNDSGIHESSDATTNLATSARCLGGNALNCLMKVCAVTPETNHDGMSLASAQILA